MLELKGLSKAFHGMRAVDNLSFTVQRGDVLGFIGPNGAGKTTTIRMLATLLTPDAGTAIVNGYDIVKEPDAARSALGYMPDFFGVYDEMRVWEYLDFFAAAYRVPRRDRPQLASDVLELVDLAERRDSYVDTLSRGMKQRLCLAKTLIHDPAVLLLDEPASGLDPRARIEMRQLLQELGQMQKTIIISSHILTELAELCNKVAIIEQGRLVWAGPVEEVARRRQEGRRLLVRLTERRQEACDFLARCPGVVQSAVVEEDILLIFSGDLQQQRAMLATLVSEGYPLETFQEDVTDLEEAYMELTREVTPE